MSEWDAESKAMNEACLYLEQSDQWARQRFIYHLVHRYFPTGEFRPTKRIELDFSKFAEGEIR